MQRGFTLIELLIVITIVAVLATVVVLVLNPAQLIMQARDSNRVSDLATLNTSLGLSLADNAGESLGSANTVYVSVPDPTATSTAGDQCQGLGLPALPPAYTYHCANATYYRKTDGTGWIPVNLWANTFGSSLAQLPIDPTNVTSSRLWYTYETDGAGRYEATTAFESTKYRLGGSNDQVSGDGGTLATVYEKGSKLGLEPLDYGDPALVGYWAFDDGTGTVAYDYSGSNATGSWQGTQAGSIGYYSAGKVGAYAGQFNGSNDYASVPSLGNYGNISASFWICPNNQSQFSAIVAKGDNVSNNSWWVYFSAGKLHFTIYTASANYTGQVSSGAVPNGMWTHVAATYDGTTLLFYVNGSLWTTVAGGGSIQSSSVPGTIGSLGAGSYFNGLIDDVRVYNRSLSAAEIQALYSGGK